MKKFFIIYASVFALIWTGYGLYAVLTGKPSANVILGFGIGFQFYLCGFMVFILAYGALQES